MKYALIVVDMLKDNVEVEEHGMIVKEAQRIVPGIQGLLQAFRKRGLPVIFACDSFLKEDLMFQGRLKPHSLRGSEGARVIDGLKPQPGELVMEKRSMSAFFRTDLDLTLRALQVDAIAVCGISTAVCVLFTAVDAVASGFRSVIVSDCSAAHKPEVHQTVLDLYGKGALYPVMRVLKKEELEPLLDNA